MSYSKSKEGPYDRQPVKPVGNGIIQSKAAQKQLIQDNHKLGLQVKDLLEKDERSTAEIARLKKLTSDYGTICKDCNRGTDNQLKLTKANRHLKNLNNWQSIALSVASIVIMYLLMGVEK